LKNGSFANWRVKKILKREIPNTVFHPFLLKSPRRAAPEPRSRAFLLPASVKLSYSEGE
jgi:hypothetical protein